MNAQGIRRVLSRIAHEILDRNEPSQDIALLGVQRGGVHLAQRLALWPAGEGVTMLDQLGEEGVRLRAEQAHRFDIRALSPENVEGRWAWADPFGVDHWT